MKCDEGKPACLRCTSTGRKCDGYTAPGPNKRRKKQAPRAIDRDAGGLASSHQSALTPGICYPPPYATGEQSIQSFWSATRNGTAWQLGDEFWRNLAFPAAVYPAVQHSLHAVSALYVAYMMREHAVNPSQGVLDTPSSRAALIRYNQAVWHVSNDMRQGVLSSQVVLICCLLFVWLELLRNDFVAGLRHLKSGLLIIQGDNRHIDHSVVHMFTRLQLQATIHGCPASDFNYVPLKCPSEAITKHIPNSFQTEAIARHYLDSKLVSIFQFVRLKQQFESTWGSTANTHPEWSQFMRSRDSQLEDLQRWSTAFRNSPTLTYSLTNDTGSVEVLLLAMASEMAFMVLANLFSDSEMDYDQYHGNFERLTKLAERIVGSPRGDKPGERPETPLPKFSLDVGIIPCLFYVALKCRDAGIRRRAMAALRLAPEREGMWHRDSMVAAALWKMGVEDSRRQNVDSLPGPAGGQLPALARIHHEKVVDADVNGGPARVRFVVGDSLSVGNVECEVHGLLSRLGDMI